MDTGCHLELLRTPYVPSVFRNLISVSKLNMSEFNVKCGHDFFSLYKNTALLVQVYLVTVYIHGNLIMFLLNSYLLSHHNIELKLSMPNGNSAYLWHNYLGHISKESLKSLTEDGILYNLDFTVNSFSMVTLRESKLDIIRKEQQEAHSS